MADAVILVPGITGTTLVDTYGPAFDTIWSAVQKRFETIESLALDPTGTFDLGQRNLIEPGGVESLAYGECVGYLRSKLDRPVFFFRYDWRRSCAVNAEYLQRFVELVLEKADAKKSGATTVALVTHSMGALIALAMLQAHPSLIRRLERTVLTVPPLLGSPMAPSALIVGEGGPLYLNSNTKFRRVARTCPSVHELVPTYPGAFTRAGAPLHGVPWDVTQWQQRIDLDQLDPVDAQEERDRLALLERHLLSARAFHATKMFDLDQQPDDVRGRFTVLAGTGVATPRAIEVLAKNSAGDVANFFDFSNFPAATADAQPGDGTVPLVSTKRYRRVRCIEVPVGIHCAWWTPFTFDDAAKLKLAGYHGAFLTPDKNLSVVREILSGREIDPSYLPGIQR